MSEQHFRRDSIRSRGQKDSTARDPYTVIPPSHPLAGAFPKSEAAPRDVELSLFYDERLHKAREERMRRAS